MKTDLLSQLLKIRYLRRKKKLPLRDKAIIYIDRIIISDCVMRTAKPLKFLFSKNVGIAINSKQLIRILKALKRIDTKRTIILHEKGADSFILISAESSRIKCEVKLPCILVSGENCDD